MIRSYKEVHKKFLDDGKFFETFPTLSGVWSQDKDKFPELLVDSVKSAINSNLETPRPVMKDVNGQFVSPNTSDSIINRLKLSDKKKRAVEIHLQKLVLDIELYNLDCEKGFEITIQDVINNYKSRNKKLG